jgi:hypothetical protein
MALSFAKHFITYESDIINSFFEISSEAENVRDKEYKAAVMLQRNWRGMKINIH